MEIRYYGDKITNHIAKTPEGFLICQDVPISRTGYQTYLSSEMFDNPENGHRAIPVYRPAEEVFNVKSLASFEGKPVTNEHPDEDVTPENYSRYSCGHVQNVHVGTGEDSNKVLADLYITDPKLIHLIQHGKREISCGYYAEERRDASGRICQTRIRGNHVAVVKNGRAGKNVCIRDRKPDYFDLESEMKKKRHYWDEDLSCDEEMLDEDLSCDEDVCDDEYLADDDFSDDDYMADEEVCDDDCLEDEDVCDDDFEDEDEFSDEDFSEDDDPFVDEDFEDDEEFSDEDLEDDGIDEGAAAINAKADSIMRYAKKVLRDAHRELIRTRKLRDAVILNDDDLEGKDVCDDDLIQSDSDLCDDDYLADDEFVDEDFSDDELEDEDFSDDDFSDEDFEDDDFSDDELEDEDLSCDSELEDEDVCDSDSEDDDTCSDDVEITETGESEAIDEDKTRALREITEASRGITDPNERKSLQDAIYKALCKKTQMPGLMNCTKKYRSKVDSAPSKGKVNVADQQSIYDSFNPHKKTSF